MSGIYDKVTQKTDEEKIEENQKRLKAKNDFSSIELDLETGKKSTKGISTISGSEHEQSRSFLRQGQSSEENTRIHELRCVKVWKWVAVLAIVCLVGSIVWHIILMYHRFDQERQNTYDNHKNQLKQEREKCAQELEKQLAEQRQLFEQEKENLIASHNKDLEQEKMRFSKQLQEEQEKHADIVEKIQAHYKKELTKAVERYHYYRNSGRSNESSFWTVLSAIFLGLIGQGNN